MIQSECCNDLCNYDLDVNLFKRFNLEVYEVLPIRKTFIINTNCGNKILKKATYDIKELNFINLALNYINKSFNRTMNFVKSIDGKVYTIWNNDIYFIMDLVNGRESEFNNPLDINIASKGLALLHNAGQNINSYINFQSRNNCEKIIETLKRKKTELSFFKSIANLYENKNEFDEIFLKNANYNIKLAQKSIDLLEKSSYYSLCKENDKIVLCHHDLAHHNIIIKNNNAYFVDFDYCIIDLRVHDLCNFITKVVKTFDYNIDKCKYLLREYNINSLNKLDKREMQVLYGMLIFPEDFYCLTKDYYTKRKNWKLDTFISKLKRKVELKEQRETFLIEFHKLI